MIRSLSLPVLNAVAYDLDGEPGRASLLYQRAAEIYEGENNQKGLTVELDNLGEALSPSGQLRRAETAIRLSIGLCREKEDRFQESVGLYIVGAALARRDDAQSHVALRRSLAILIARSSQEGEGHVSTCLAQRCLWLGQAKQALPLAQRAWELADVTRIERQVISAVRLHGEAVLIGDLATAEERLHHALTRARAVNLVEEELPALTALAELHRQRKEYDTARELLDQVWAPAERGPYPLFHADARNVLARIERDEGHRDAAIAALTRAYELAWCDGPPYAYHFGLTNAKQLLVELGAPEPRLPPFDEAKFEPMPDVEINPKDEFWVDPATLDSTPEE